ncbi:hypothetical protein BD311DRAFT_663740, partial [Dichomitus squalens]
FTNCWTFASTALLAYDYTLTFGNEVTLFWTGGHRSGATVLFILNRYITLAAQSMNLVPIPSSVEVCHPTAFSGYVAASVLGALQYLPWAAFSALRSYALSPDSYRWIVSASVFALASVPIVINMWANLHGLSLVSDPVLGITFSTPISASTNLKLEVVTRSSLIASDLVVLCVTWYRTYETARLSLRERGRERETFASIILLDGAKLILNRTLLILSVLQMTLTSILTSRFLINLQKAQRRLEDSSSGSVSLGEVAFQQQMSRNTSRFIGSLGGQLSFHGDDREENDVEYTS